MTTTLTVPTANSDKLLSRILGEPSFAIHQPTPIREDLPLEQRVPLLIVRDLLRLGWRLRSNSNKSLELVPPTNYEKPVIKAAMAYSRNEIIEANKIWIEKHLDLVEAIKAGDADRAEQIMRDHVQEFYDKVREILAAG